MARWERGIAGTQSTSQEKQPLSNDLITIFLSSIGAIVPALQQPNGDGLTIAEEQFRKSQPRFDVRSPQEKETSSEDAPSSSPIWQELRSTVEELGLNLEKLSFERRSAPTSDVATNSPISAIETQRDAAAEETRSASMSTGAFVIYVHLIAFDPRSSTTLWDASRAQVNLQSSLPLLLAAFGSSAQMPAAGFGAGKSVPSMRNVLSDSALIWLQWCFDAFSKNEKNDVVLPEGVILALVPALSVHAALSPSPTTRHMSFRLVATILDRHTEDEILLDILFDLVAETPFPQLRDASVNLLRELVGSRLPLGGSSTPSRGGSSLASRKLLEVLGEHLFTLPDGRTLPQVVEQDQPGFDSARQSATSYLEEYSTILTSSCGLYYFLLKRDSNNLVSFKQVLLQSLVFASLILLCLFSFLSFSQTGIRDTSSIKAVEECFLSPLRNGIKAWSPIFAQEVKSRSKDGDSKPSFSDSDHDPQAALTILQVLELSLTSADETVRSLLP